MATRRSRIKAVANLPIRRPPKASDSLTASESQSVGGPGHESVDTNVGNETNKNGMVAGESTLEARDASKNLDSQSLLQNQTTALEGTEAPTFDENIKESSNHTASEPQPKEPQINSTESKAPVVVRRGKFKVCPNVRPQARKVESAEKEKVTEHEKVSKVAEYDNSTSIVKEIGKEASLCVTNDEHDRLNTNKGTHNVDAGAEDIAEGEINKMGNGMIQEKINFGYSVPGITKILKTTVTNEIEKGLELSVAPQKDPTLEEKILESGMTTQKDTRLEEASQDGDGNKENERHTSKVKQGVGRFKSKFIRPRPNVGERGARKISQSQSYTSASESEDEGGKRSAPQMSLAQPVRQRAVQRPVVAAGKRIEEPEEVNETTQDATVEQNGEKDHSAAQSGKGWKSTRTRRPTVREKENPLALRRREFRRRFEKGAPSRSQMTMFDLIYWNPPTGHVMSNASYDDDNPENTEEIVISEAQEDPKETRLIEESVDDPENEEPPVDEPTNDDGDGVANEENGDENAAETEKDKDGDEEEEEDDGIPAPQVKVGPNGEIILDEKSLVIETTGAKEGRKDLMNSPLVVENCNGFTNYGTYSKRKKTADWGKKETVQFYRALSGVGTDFSLMSTLMPWRGRQELKAKFKKEERMNPELIEQALQACTQFDLSEFSPEKEDDPPPKKKRQPRKRKSSETSKKEGRKSRRSKGPKRRGSGHPIEITDSEDEDGNLEELEDNEDQEILPAQQKHTNDFFHFMSPRRDEESNQSNRLEEGAATDDSTNKNLPDTHVVDKTNEVEGSAQNTNDIEDVAGRDFESYEVVGNDGDDEELVSVVRGPTRSGRVPKRKEVFEFETPPTRTRRPSAASKSGSTKREGKRRRSSAKSNDSDSMSSLSNSWRQSLLSPPPLSMSPGTPFSQQILSPVTPVSHQAVLEDEQAMKQIEPGSLVLLATPAPDDPTRHIVQVFMVSPPDGSQSQDSSRMRTPSSLPASSSENAYLSEQAASPNLYHLPSGYNVINVPVEQGSSNAIPGMPDEDSVRTFAEL